MADLIDRQELLKHKGNCYDEEGHLLYAVGTGTILLMPTVDAVPVVRCKDCEYGEPNGQYGCKCYHYKLYETHEMSPNDFCSYAKRREDAKTD